MLNNNIYIQLFIHAYLCSWLFCSVKQFLYGIAMIRKTIYWTTVTQQILAQTNFCILRSKDIIVNIYFHEFLIFISSLEWYWLFVQTNFPASKLLANLAHEYMLGYSIFLCTRHIWSSLEFTIQKFRLLMVAF